MKRLGWFLLGGLVTLLVGDWAQLRFFQTSWKETAARCVEFSQTQVAQVSQCEETLRTCHGMIGDDASRARLVLATKVQTVALIRASVKGDKEAQKALAEIGWTKDLNAAGKKIADRFDELSVEAEGGVGGPKE